MRRIKSCGLFVLSLTVLSTGLSVLLSVPSSAASAYDQLYQTTSNVSAWNRAQQKSVDLSFSYMGVILDQGNWSTNYEITNVIKDAPRWGVSQTIHQSYESWSTQNYIQFYYSLDDSMQLQWVHNGSWGMVDAVSSTGQLCFIRITGSTSGVRDYDVSGTCGVSAVTVSNWASFTTARTYNFFVNVPQAAMNYPVGYAGGEIVDSVIEKVSYAPRVTISVEDKHISGNICMDKTSSICGIPPGFGQELSVTYKIYPKVDPTNKLLEQGGSLVSGQMTFALDVADYSDYILEARFYLPIPFVEPDDVEFQTLKLPIKVDGSSYMSSSVKQKCVIGGECEQPSVLRDCSIYDMADITEINKLGPLLSCHLDNYGLRLNSFFREYFVLDAVLVKYEFNKAVELVKESLGVLWSPLEFILRMFGLITEQGTNPVGDNCYLGTFTLFGGTAPIYLCQWRQQLPQLFSIMQVVMRAGIAIGLFFMFWGKLHELMGIRIPDFDDDDDEYGDLSGARWYDDRTGESGSISDGSIGRRGGSR